MRNLFYSLLAVLSFAGIANAQEDTNAPVLLGEKFVDHTFIGVNAGINTLYARETTLKDQTNKLTLDLDFYLGKWFTPSIGAKIGFQKMNVSEEFPANFYSHSILSTTPTDGKYKFGGNYLYGAFMYNIGNGIWGYKDRTINVIPYLHAGWVRMYDPETGVTNSDYKDDEFGAGPAIMITAKLAKRLSLVLDVKDVILSGRFHDYSDAGYVNNLTAGLGLQFGFGATDWYRQKKCVDNSAALADAMASLAAANDALAKLRAANDELAGKLKECESRKVVPENEGDVVYIKTNLGVPPLTLYYEIGSSVLNVTELRHLDDYVKKILSMDPDRIFYLTGSADKGTGTLEINQRLIKDRPAGVREILESKYNVKDGNIIIKEGKITDENEDPRFDRSTIIEH